MILSHKFEVIHFLWNWAGGDYFYLAIFVDKYVVGMHVSHFPLDSLELVARSDHVVKQVPYFPFLEKSIYLQSVLNLSPQYVWKILINNLGSIKKYMNRTTWTAHSCLDKFIPFRQEQYLPGLSVIDSHHLGFPRVYHALAFYNSFKLHSWHNLVVFAILILYDSDRAETLMIMKSFFRAFGLLISHL